MIKVLVVDDSLFMRQAVRRILQTDHRVIVVGEAKDGTEAIEMVARLGPNVVTMDFNMPGMTGAEAVRQIMARRPTPIVMLSAVTRAGAAETLEALAAGAVDFLPKPSGEVSADLGRIQTELLAKVHAAAASTPRAQPHTAAAGGMPPAAPRTTGNLPRVTAPPWASRTLSGVQGKVVLVGISTGGPAALGRMLPMIAADVNFGMVIVQHMPADFTGPLAERLNEISAIEVREAKDGDRPRQGLALIAPGDRHLEFADGGSVRLTDGPEVNGCRPSADIMMKAGARVFGRRAVGVIMTGMGRDGAEGLAAIKAAGGSTLAQDQESSVIFGMPRAAIEAGVVEHVVPLDGLAGMITRAAASQAS